MKNFSMEAQGATFEFYSMNRRRVQLFYVYITVNGKKERFHMQLDEASGEFFITDKVHCPAEYHQAEKEFSDAIKLFGVADVMPT